MAFTPPSIDLDCRDREGREVKKKVNKMRSTKLARTPSSKPSARRVKTSRFHRDRVDSVSDDSSSELGRFEFSQESFREGNESDDASVSSSSHGSTSGTSPSLSEDVEKGRENEIRNIPKKSRFNQALTSFSSNAASPPVKVADESPDYSKATSCFEGKKLHFQGGLHVSESNYATINERKSSHYSKSNWSSSSLKSVQTLRKMSSFRTSRILINKSSFKTNRPSVKKKCSQVSKEWSVNRATYSSTLKDSKFRSHVELYPGERESKKISVIKVCPYNYCSLHGHHHSSTPQLKRILSKRRRSLKTQKSIKLRSQSSLRIKLIETSQTGVNPGQPEGDKAITSAAILPLEKAEDSDLSANFLTKSRMESFKGSREGNQDANLSEALSGETSNPEKGVEENLNQERNFSVAEQGSLEIVLNHKEAQFNIFCIDKRSSSKPDMGFHEFEHADLTGISCEPSSNLVKRSTPDDLREETADNGVISPAYVCQTPEELGPARDEKNGDLLKYEELVDQFAAVEDSELKSQLHKKNHISMWHLLHQHMMSGLENHNTNIENHDAKNQENELHTVCAVKMVREAIEQILLPEVQDQSFDDRSISSEITSKQELLEKNNGQSGKLTISNGGKAEKKKLKSWSNLKKLILLKRFIKALEKVRKFNPETEKVGLKHQMMDRKKSSEEWMLDFALQQVVGELAPTQKRKVALLIKAFETVVPPSDEQRILMTFPELKGIRHEGSSTQTEMDKGVPDEAIYRDTKVEEDTVESNVNNAVKNSIIIITDKQSIACEDRISSFNSELLKDDFASGAQTMKVDGLSNITGLPLKPFDIVSRCSEEVPTMNSEFCTEGDPEPNREKLEISKLTMNSDNTVMSSACDWGPMQELTAAKEQKYGDSELKNEAIEGFGRFRDSEHDNSCHKAYKTEFDNEKHASMWHLIHQHMVAGLAVEGKTRQLDKEMECHDTDNQDVELRKTYAIKLVQEAIENILLPEVQDQSSDDQSITSETMSDQGLIEKSHSEGGEPSILTSTDSSKDRSMDLDRNIVRDDTALSQERTGFATANISESENEKAASEVQSKTEKQITKGWSNLKKWILLKRFIRELEKVKRFNPQKPLNLPLKPDLEAEEVCLRHQMVDERKSAEEWTLDYAIRKVVSELAPQQKRKVALLVKAFETVAPPSEEPQIQVAFPKFIDTDSKSCCRESEQGKFVSQSTEADIKVKNVVSSKLDNGNFDSTISDKKSDVTMDEEYHQEVHEDTVSSYRSELLKDGSESTSKHIHLDGLRYENVEPSYAPTIAAPDGNTEPTVTYNVASSASASDPLEQLIAAKEKKNGDSATDCEIKVAYKTTFDKQKYISMWHILCQHVVSDIATKVETRLLDEDDKDEEVNNAKTLFQPEFRTGSCHEEDHDTGNEDFDSSSEKTRLSQSDALKLVKEAIEEILPEIQVDTADTQSIASDIIPEEEFIEKNHYDVGDIIKTSIDSSKDSCRECGKSELECNNRINQEERESKNWSKVKKLVLLKRSIEALEKARRSNLRAPKNLLWKPESEKEKVDRKHRLKDEKKKAEEWMLDYAVQHIVSTLTPARKRRVSMLVEAFEAVVPLPDIGL
ncbi:hypothetical protein U1Q18_012981 [Sarracenia purpurea var. burkii]